MSERAFPSSGNGVYSTEPGMSLRDYFAAEALQGLISHPNRTNEIIILAEESYKMADAMMAAREKGGSDES